jgi:hypothetical protein
VLVIQSVAKRIEARFPTRRRDVHRPTADQLDPGRDDVDVSGSVVISVKDRAPGVLIRIKSRKGCTLKLIECVVYLRIGWVVVGVPGNHARGVSIDSRQGVNEPANLRRIAAKHPNVRPHLALAVALAHQVTDGSPPTAC